MILSEQAIRRSLTNGELVIRDLPAGSVQPASVDLRLAGTFLMVDERAMEHVDLESEVKYRRVETDTIIIPPHSFVLAQTMEFLEVPTTMCAFIEGRSSIGRIGLFIQNAGWIDPGFSGHFTLQLYNANPLPIKLDAGRRVCQVVFCRMEGDATAYRGKYQNQVSATGSRIFRDVEIQR